MFFLLRLSLTYLPPFPINEVRGGEAMEEWRTVVIDGEVWDNYEVSNLGRVRSLNWRNSGKIKMLEQHDNGSGYLRVHLCKNGKQKWYMVHRLVAFAFIENDDPVNKVVVNHLDENPLNCHVSNLEWTTQLENVHYGIAIERRSKRVRCVEIGEIFESTMDVQRKLGFSNSTISACCNGKRKTCGGFHWEYVD